MYTHNQFALKWLGEDSSKKKLLHLLRDASLWWVPSVTSQRDRARIEVKNGGVFFILESSSFIRLFFMFGWMVVGFIGLQLEKKEREDSLWTFFSLLLFLLLGCAEPRNNNQQSVIRWKKGKHSYTWKFFLYCKTLPGWKVNVFVFL